MDQNIKGALGIADHVYVMRTGTLFAEGPRDEFSDDVETLVSRGLGHGLTIDGRSGGPPSWPSGTGGSRMDSRATKRMVLLATAWGALAWTGAARMGKNSNAAGPAGTSPMG